MKTKQENSLVPKLSAKGAWKTFWHVFWDVFVPWVARTLEKPWITKYDDTVPNKLQQLQRKTPITYYDTAMRRPKKPSPNIANLPPGWDMFQKRRVPDGTQCHDYLYSYMAIFHPISDNHLTARRTRHEYEDEKELDALVDFDMPAAHLANNGGSAILMLFEFLMQMFRYMFYGAVFFLAIPSILIIPFFIYKLGLINTLSNIHITLYMYIGISSIPLIFYCVLKLIWESRILHKILWKPKMLAALRRDKGVLELYKNNKPYREIPFDEIEARLRVMPPGAFSATITSIMSLHHSVTGEFIWNNVNMNLGVKPGEEYTHAIDWEIWQHFMDTSRPLPDIPMFEPYRCLDPTTIEWDKKHGRPPKYWETLDAETFWEMQLECYNTVPNYPFTDPEKAKEIGWKPAGDGKHWYQLG